jgi:polar amino acid transport system substrate-binding protein
MKFNKRIWIVAVVTALSLPFAAPIHAQSALDNIQKAKLIKIAIPTDFPPYGFVGTDLQPQGLDIDMANYIGQKLGVKVELIPVISANRIPYLQTKKADFNPNCRTHGLQLWVGAASDGDFLTKIA